MKKDELLMAAKKLIGDKYDVDPKDLNLISLRSNETLYSYQFAVRTTVFRITIDNKGNLIDAFKC